MASSHPAITLPPDSRFPSAVPSIDSDHYDNISTPATPDDRFRSRPLRNNSAEVSLRHHAHPCSHHDSTNYPDAHPATPPPKPLEPATGPPSPSGLANVRIRRSQHGSLLLQSPARAGHAARMRQIFEHASREQQPLQPGSNPLYPQLPNVSRKASPPLAQPSHVRNPSQQTFCARPLQSLCMSTASARAGPRHAQAVFAGVSEQSSESWSDDSGYLVVGSRISNLARAFVPDDRIMEWLTGVSTPDYDEHEDARVQGHDAWVRPESCQGFSEFSSDTASSRLARRPLESRQIKATAQDVFYDKDHASTRSDFISSKSLSPLKEPVADLRSIHSPTRPTTPTHLYYRDANHQLFSSNDELQLSPLSPNVCVERGPSRHHSSRNMQYGNRASPTTTHYTPSKENMAPRDSVHEQSAPVPEAPCKVGVGTRFQHPRHTPVTRLGRWARNVQP